MTLTIEIYSTGTTKIYDVGSRLLDARGIWWETFFPAGKYGAAGCFIPRDTSHWWEVNGSYRAVIRSGQKIIYEGKVSDLTDVMSANDEGTQISLTGLWGYDLASKTWRKRWADDRTDESTWPWQTGVSGAEKVIPADRRERIKFVPKNETFAVNDYAAVRYTMPYGQTIKRIVFDYNLTGVAGEDWTASVYDIDNSSTEWSVNQVGAGSSSGSVDIDSTSDFTAMQEIEIRFTATGGSTPASDGSTYLSITELMIYSEDEGANNITLQTVAADIAAEWTSILSSTTSIHAPSTARSIEPFFTTSDDFESLDSILMRALAPGDGDDNRMSVCLLNSESVASPDGLPVLCTSEYPDVDAGYDYFISPDAWNLNGTLKLTHDYIDELYNYIPVTYTNKDGIKKYLDPDETTSLKDTTSIAAYGERHLPLNLGYQTAATAQEYGEKVLANRKDPRWTPSRISVSGYILDDAGQRIPAEQIEACGPDGVGKRIKVDGYDTFLISRVRVELLETGEVRAMIDTGQPGGPFLEQQEFAVEFDDSVIPGAPTTGGATSSGGPSLPERIPGGVKMKRRDRARWRELRKDIQRIMRSRGVNAKTAWRELGSPSW